MTKSILILGAGRSSASLIKYMSETCLKHEWKLTVGDYSLTAVENQTKFFSITKAIHFDIQNKAQSGSAIKSNDIVISLLPAHLHYLVAELCVEFKKHLITASYVTNEMKAFHKEAEVNDVLLLNECGLDPGIDHMSAMKMIDTIKAKGGVIDSFYSFTGGLISSETDPENPWRYKFTWNSRNVVMAGQSTAKYLDGGEYKYIPYQQLFKRTINVHVHGLGDYEGYANRDSLKYISAYGLDNIKTMLRGTLRSKGFCSAWDLLVQLGCCDDTYEVDHLDTMTHATFLSSFVAKSNDSLKKALADQLNVDIASPEISKLEWVGLFSDEPIGLNKGTPAQALEFILNKKWKLSESDKDQIVMWHKLVFNIEGKRKEIQATLVSTGENSLYTAMAQTVGLPLGIAAKLLALGHIKSRGVVIPTSPEFYDPILKELAELKIELKEYEIN